MAFTETLRQGAATVRRTASKNIMTVLLEIVQADPTADNERRFKRWAEIIKDDDDYLMAALRHTFTNLNTALEKGKAIAPANSRSQRSASERTDAAKQIAERIRAVVILDIIMPNGKKLGECTGQYVRLMGGSLVKIGARVKPSQLVKDALTEQEAKKLWGD